MIKLLYIDLFCGAGGTSTGVEHARHNGHKCAKVIACVNHDINAIASHAANHPDALHFTEDIRTLELSPLVAHIEKMKVIYPEAKTVLWASLECTNFSKAKGGKSRDADSRTLAEHLFRYIEAIEPHYIQIENVEEFMSWGDLDENGKPVSRDNGRLYHKWVNKVKSYGYDFNHRILNAADFGAYTSRRRFFGQFAKHGLPIAWPAPTHTKAPQRGLFGEPLKKWKPVKDVLDFSDEGESIFARKKPLSDRTLERIYAGLIKFVAGGKSISNTNFLSAYYGNGHNQSIDKPCPVVTTVDRFAKVQAEFIDQQYGSSKPVTIDQPLGCVTKNPKYNLVSCISNETEQAAIVICETDSEPMRKIKKFMVLYGIINVKMRMLKIPELKRIMGFPEDYTLIGTQTEQKKYIGNAVEVNMSRVLCEAIINELKF